MKKLFIGNLPWSIRTDQLQELFSQFGEVEDCIVMTDRDTGRSRGFGFVTFTNAEDADKAVAEMNEKEIEGRALTVNEAKPREERNEF